MSTTDLRHPSSGMRSYLRRRFGLWPLHELKNRVLLGPKTPALRRFEDGEVARLLSVLGGVQRAACATIVPTYRRPELLKVAVESALSQTMDDNIVMVVDDGGGLPALPDHPRLRAVSLSRNTAVLGLVRNVGIRLTDSDFIAFLDDDNQWKPNHLHTAITALRGHDSEAVGPPFDAVYTAVERRMPDGVLLDTLSKPFDRAEFADQSSFVDANSIVVRRDTGIIFSRLPRVKATLPKEDWEFIYRLSKTHRIEHIAVPTVEYLVNTDSYYTKW